MLPGMLPRRVQPLAGWSIVAVFALIGAALLATVWSTRASILDASEAVRCGQADAVEQSVRADLADLEALPSSAELGAILDERGEDGLRYLAMVEGPEDERDGDNRRRRAARSGQGPVPLTVLASAGNAIGTGGENILAPRRSIG